jgi:sugar lactone lactonase YvrE
MPRVHTWLLGVPLAAVLALTLCASAFGAFGFELQWGELGTGDGQFIQPTSLAVDASGNVYVADTQTEMPPPRSDRIQKFGPSGNFILKWGGYGTQEGQLDSPNGVAVDVSGNVYVADANNHRVQAFTSSGQFLRMWGWGVQDGVTAALQVCTSGCHKGISGSGDGQLSYPSGVAIGRAGEVYVSEFNNYRVQEFSPAGTFLAKSAPVGTDTLEGVAVGLDGSVYAAVYGGAPALVKFDSQLHLVASIGSQPAPPATGDGEFSQVPDVAIDPSGLVYAIDRGGNRIEKFTPDGAFAGQFGASPQLLAPYGIAIDCRGNIFLVDANNHALKFGDPGTPPPPCVAATPPPAPDKTPPVISRVALSHRVFAVKKKGVAARRKIARGTTFSYSLSEAATVTFKIERKLRGRKVRGKCRRRTRKNAKRRRCTRYVRAGRFNQAGVAGRNRKRFSGRIGSSALRRGSYRARLTALDAAHNRSRAASVRFKVVKSR